MYQSYRYHIMIIVVRVVQLVKLIHSCCTYATLYTIEMHCAIQND